MSKKYKILVLFIAAVLAFYSVPAMAAPPMNVHIEVAENINTGGIFTMVKRKCTSWFAFAARTIR